MHEQNVEVERQGLIEPQLGQRDHEDLDGLAAQVLEGADGVAGEHQGVPTPEPAGIHRRPERPGQPGSSEEGSRRRTAGSPETITAGGAKWSTSSRCSHRRINK